MALTVSPGRGRSPNLWHICRPLSGSYVMAISGSTYRKMMCRWWGGSRCADEAARGSVCTLEYRIISCVSTQYNFVFLANTVQYYFLFDAGRATQRRYAKHMAATISWTLLTLKLTFFETKGLHLSLWLHSAISCLTRKLGGLFSQTTLWMLEPFLAQRWATMFAVLLICTTVNEDIRSTIVWISFNMGVISDRCFSRPFHRVISSKESDSRTTCW
jgi:hypothetical protein